MANPTVFASASAAGLALTATVGVSSATLNGDTLVMGVHGTATGSDPTGITDTQGNIWSLRDSQTGSLPHLFVFECMNAGPLALTDTLTITYAGTGSAVAAVGVDVPSFPNGIDVDQKATGTTASATKATGVLASKGETVLAFEAHLNAGGAPTWSGGFTSLATEHNGSSAYLSASFDVPTAVTSLTPAAAITSTTWNIIVVSYPLAPVTVLSSLSGAIKNQAYSQTLTASGGSGAYTWAVTSGALPTGLSLASGVISGTPTAAVGNYTFTVTATDAVGNTGSAVETIQIVAIGSTASGTQLAPNQLTNADAFGKTGFTWVADTNANAPALTSNICLDGNSAIAWTSAADGDSSIHTGFYTCKGSKGFIASGFMLMTNAANSQCEIGIEWYDNTSTLIRTDLSMPGSMGAFNWCPITGAFTSPSNAVKFRVVVVAQATNKGDTNVIDIMFATRANAQILVDWYNDPLVQTPGESSTAGAAFMDISPWVRVDQSISLARGRQDNISEVGAGSATFTLENDSGVFTGNKATSLVNVSGGRLILQRRAQVNFTDQLGVWHTRFDGPITEMDFVGNNDNTGNTQWVPVTCGDVLAPLTRADDLRCWTRETVKADGPQYTWALDDTGNTGAFGQAVESSGNNGPPMRTFNKDPSGFAAIAWQDGTAGVESLADAVALGEPDGSEYWSAGSNVPSSVLRGLDSGTVGPYSTPQSSVFLSPVFATQATLAENSFIGNTGYCLFCELGAKNEIATNQDDFSIELWFSMDTSGNVQTSPLSLISGTPFTAMKASAQIGPYCQLGLGSARQLTNVVAGMFFDTTSAMKYEVVNYPQPPAFIANTWASTITPLDTLSKAFVPDRLPIQNNNSITIAGGSLIHHLVLTCAGVPGGAPLSAYLDGKLLGTITLQPGQVFDTIYLGSAFGGQGAHFGNISMASLYGYVLSPSQITDHCSKGQYGMWEQTTDNCISQLATYAAIPSFWNNLQGLNNGLTMTDYQDITGSNAISNMQLFEQAEQGLIFVDASGKLNYHTRDWRMGYGAPDLLLPPGTYDASTQLSLIDQFQANQAGYSSQTYQTGAGFVNSESRNTYGDYTLSSSSEPTAFPFITFSRAYSLLGMPNLAQWPDPHLNDAAAWVANTRSEPWLIPSALQVDVLAPDTPAGCPTLSQWYAIEIDNMIAPSGTQPASSFDVGLSSEWFVEGINETVSDQQHVFTFYVSPAETQRAWKPGDATYGVLGTTTRIGISAPDLNVVYVNAKDVSHDAGPPYVPPSQAAMSAGTLNNPAANGHGFIGGMDMRGMWDNLAKVIEPPMLIVGADHNAQVIANGATTSPQLIWDTIYADTANGMGIIGGWPNWYVVTVPGFYEIDAAIVGAPTASGDSGGIQGWIVVAEEGAQGVASGAVTPLAGSLYLCPIGEHTALNNNSDSTVMSPTTTLYLGIGDMITVACQQSKTSGTKNLAFSNLGGSSLSLRWISNSVYADKCRSNSSIVNGGTVTDATPFIPQTFQYTNTGSASYLGTPSNKHNPGSLQRAVTNGSVRQGRALNNALQTGSQYGGFKFSYNTINSDLSGFSLVSASLTAHCNHGTAATQQPTPKMMLGFTSSAVFGQYTYEFNNTGDFPDLAYIPFTAGATITSSIDPSIFVACFTNHSARALTVGNNSTIDTQFYGEWDGGIGNVTLTVVAIP